MFCLLDLSFVFLAHTTMTRHGAQGRSPAPLQYPLKGCPDTTRYKAPRAQANHHMLPSWPRIPSYPSHTAPQPASSSSEGLWLFQHVWLKWIHKVAFWQEREGSHGQYLLHTCLLIQSETRFYDLPHCLLTEAPTASQANSPNQISSTCSLCIQHPENKVSFTTHLKLAQKQANVFSREKPWFLYFLSPQSSLSCA